MPFCRLLLRCCFALLVFQTIALGDERTFDPQSFDDFSWQPNPAADEGDAFAADWPASRQLPSTSYEPPLFFPATTVAFGWLAPGGAEGFGSADFDVHHNFQWELSHPEPIVIAPGFGAHLWSGPQLLDLPPRVYDVYLDISWRMVSRDWWGLTGGVTPGFYGDFERIDGDTFQFTGWLLGDWTLSDRWTIVGGLAYVRQLKSNLLPVGGVIWRPNDELQVDLVVPRPRIARRLSSDSVRESWLYLSGTFGGGAWSVDDGSENVLVQYSDFRLCLGLERLQTNGGTMQLEIGYVFSRDIAIDQFSVLTPDGTALVQLSTSF